MRHASHDAPVVAIHPVDNECLDSSQFYLCGKHKGNLTNTTASSQQSLVRAILSLSLQHYTDNALLATYR
jgi:hypothetical protein